MKKEYKKPVVETTIVELSEMMASSIGEGNIDPDGPVIEGGGAANEYDDEDFDW